MNSLHENIFHILDYFTIFEVSQACLLVFILLAMKRNRRANIFFSLFIMFLSLNFFSMFLHARRYELTATILMLLSVPGISIIGVLIYFYTSLATGFIKQFKVKHCAHFIIYLALFIALLLSDCLLGRYHAGMKCFQHIMFLFIGVGLINSMVYIIISFINLRKYYSKIENYYSDIEKYDMNWLIKLTSLSLIFFVIWNADFWLSYFAIIKRNPLWIFSNICLLMVIIFMSAYYLINKPDTSMETKEMFYELEAEKERSDKEKYAKQSIDETMKEDYLHRIQEYMEKNKPYINENITIKDLAVELAIPSHHLSIVINTMLNMNFYTFINEYRIKEAIGILEKPTNAEASIISIAFKSGFNSKSTFNRVFKKIIGKTPSEYRNSLMKKS